MLKLVDEDTRAFNKIMEAFAMPKKSDEEKRLRDEAVQTSTKSAIEVPLKVMKLAYSSFEIIQAMAETGNPNSVSDAGVGALCAHTAVMGAYLNVKINAASLKDKDYRDKVMKEGQRIVDETVKKEKEVIEIVDRKIVISDKL